MMANSNTMNAELTATIDNTIRLEMVKLCQMKNAFLLSEECTKNVKQFFKEWTETPEEEIDKIFRMSIINLIEHYNLKECCSCDEYLVTTRKICNCERKNGSVCNVLSSYDSFAKLGLPLQKTIVLNILYNVFNRLMFVFEIGIEQLKISESKKKKTKGLDSEAETTSARKNDDVLRYVAGFAVKVLTDGKCPQETLKNLSKDMDISSSCDPTEDWNKKISRGGLKNVTDNFFDLILKIKSISDQVYSKPISEIRNICLKNVTMEEILKNKEIQTGWQNLHHGPDGDKWLKVFLSAILNTRGKVLVKDIKEQFQNDTKEVLKAKKALRKDLKAKSEQKAKENSAKKLAKSKLLVTSQKIKDVDLAFLDGDPDADLFMQFL